MNICVLIPAHNEEKFIAAVVQAVKARGLDVIVVDDGSVDATGRLAEDNGAVVLRNEPRQGKGFSLKRGFAYVLEHGYGGVITMDGDGQHDAQDLSGFINAARQSPQSVINGTRMRQTQSMPWLRRVTNRFMSWLISCLCGRRIEDTQCGYRYLGRDVLASLQLTANDFEIETEILLKAAKAGFPITAVAIKTIYRDEKSKINPLKDTVRFFAYLWRECKAKK